MGKSVTILSLYIALPRDIVQYLCFAFLPITEYNRESPAAFFNKQRQQRVITCKCTLCMHFVYCLCISYYCINNFVSFSCFMLPPICTSLSQTKLSGRQTLNLLVVPHYCTLAFFTSSLLSSSPLSPLS